ncbi:MAG TPA: hypothetical protein VF604_04030 [Pyrinomonadaceae bacterium]|jgi:urease accessory protein UreF
MSRAILDINELKRFIAALQRTQAELNEKKRRMGQKFKDLSEVWQDAKYKRFEQKFNETTAQIDQFSKYADMYIDHLKRKGELAQRYLER